LAVLPQYTNQLAFFSLPISGIGFAVRSGGALLGSHGDRIARL
jgi:hypothetical protein